MIEVNYNEHEAFYYVWLHEETGVPLLGSGKSKSEALVDARNTLQQALNKVEELTREELGGL